MSKKHRNRGQNPYPRPTSPTNVSDNLPAETANANGDRELRQKVEQTLEPVIGGVHRRDEVVERVVTLVRGESFRGPLPHPRHFAEYERVCPGMADRLTAMAELALSRNEDRRDKYLQHEIDDRRLGMVLGFGALVLVLGTGIAFALMEHVVLGGGIVTAGLIGAAVSPFINGRGKPSLPWQKKRPPPAEE